MKAAVSSLLAGCASFYDSMHLEPCISSPQNAYDHLTSDCNLDQTLSGLNRIHDESHLLLPFPMQGRAAPVLIIRLVFFLRSTDGVPL